LFPNRHHNILFFLITIMFAFAITLVLCTVIGTTFAVPATAAIPVCTAAQLKGTWSSFSLPGGGGTYYAGTNQVVSWNWATGSKVTAIKSVSICQGANCFSPLSTTGIPVTFTASQPDQAGGINVQLPYTMQSGSSVFRVNLTSGGKDCTIDSASFTAIGGNVNGNECAFGDSLCYQGNLIVPCIEQGAGTLPNIWGYGHASQCPGTCIQNGNKATCVFGGGNPGGPCASGTMKCTSTTSFSTCNFGAYGPSQNCPGGTTCKPYLTDYIICSYSSEWSL